MPECDRLISKSFRLTLPERERELLAQQYENADCILEYGSGGSTLLAANDDRRKVFAVESDREWAHNLQREIAVLYPQSPARIHHAFIGRTREWGHARKYSRWMVPFYLRYATSVWTRRDFAHPDVVLVDGRFRVGCFIAVASKIKRQTRLLFDDYLNRKEYSFVEKFVKPRAMCGRMAIFDLDENSRPDFCLENFKQRIIPR